MTKLPSTIFNIIHFPGLNTALKCVNQISVARVVDIINIMDLPTTLRMNYEKIDSYNIYEFRFPVGCGCLKYAFGKGNFFANTQYGPRAKK